MHHKELIHKRIIINASQGFINASQKISATKRINT